MLSTPQSKPTVSLKTICEREGGHRYFVASRVLTSKPSTIIIVAMCTSCGDHNIIIHPTIGEIVAFGDDTPTLTK